MISEQNQQLLAHGSFARHETFCPRYGWLKKGVDGVKADVGVFERPDAIELLGVGKNMVRAIKHWCLAFKLIEAGGNGRKGAMAVTPFGNKLLSDDGWDPYLEDPASLWLLHWRLFTPPILAPAWSMAVNIANIREFSARDLKARLIEYKSRIPAFRRLSDSSFEKDAACFTRMYGAATDRVSEEIECPFTQLGLLARGEKKGIYGFDAGDKPRLPDLLTLAACLDYAAKYQPESNALSLSAIAYGFNSPGVVFKLSESDLGRRLEMVTADFEGVSFVESYGSRQLLMESDAAGLREEALSRYYGKTRRMGL